MENKDREQNSTRTICKSYVIDDGWNLPEEIIEVIDLTIEEAWESAVKRVEQLRAKHKGEWLTMDVAKKYRQLAAPFLAFYDGQNIKTVRELEKELQEKYGVTELEAINIINGYHHRDYVEKYYRIKNCIPEGFDQQDICDSIAERYLSKAAM